jgi:hypothetical protein
LPATFSAIVDLPDPAGPSIAIIFGMLIFSLIIQ